MRRNLLALLVFSGCATAAPDVDWAAQARALRPAGTPGGTAVLDALEARAKELLAAIEHPTDRASWEKAVPRLREQLARSLGTPRLEGGVRALGELRRDGYRIEKLVFDAFGEVPAHVYLPLEAKGRLPAVLFVPGHWWADSKTKPEFQALCAVLALRGFAVLTYDPIGQGERGISWRDHRRTESLLHGTAQMGLALAEARRALDVLMARPEVDPERVGVTGASGGGYTSWILPALDPRIKVSVPVVGTSEFHEQLSAVRERDWYDAKEHCHFVPGLLRYANNHEFVAMLAPRPLMFIAAHNDHSFRIPGNREIADYGRSLYGALGASEKVAYVEDDTEGHGYGKKKREAAVGWFLKWLKGEGDGSSAAEPSLALPAWDAKELRCFPENRSAGRAIADRFRAAPKARPLAERLPGVLGIPLPPRLTSAPKLDRRVDGIGRVAWTMRDGIEVPGVVIPPHGEWKGAILGASDDGKEALLDHPRVRAAREAGWAVVLADPRGLGELAHGKPGWVFAVSLLLGESFVGRQAMDLVSCWRSLYALPELSGKPVVLLGRGAFASLAALYAGVLEPRIPEVAAEGGLESFREVLERPEASFALARPGEEKTVAIDREIPWALVPWNPGFDVAELRVAVAGRRVSVPPREVGRNPSTMVERGRMPKRVHVAEDYETDIESRWWLAGRAEKSERGRVCRGTLANDFDDKMGDPAAIRTAVIFNPVPGPPVGPRTRLAFRYWIRGCPELRVQIYSLSNGHHRHLTLSGLPQGEWREGCVDMTRLRRPDGSGGPLAEDERIDDIQFYTDASAELMIDDIVLYEAADDRETRPFPKRILFTGVFDTGRQGREWPGSFEIVPHEKPRTWKAAQSAGKPLVVGVRGKRPVYGGRVLLSSDVLRTGDGAVSLTLGSASPEVHLVREAAGWTRQEWEFSQAGPVEEIRFAVPAGATLRVDDLLLYEPGSGP
jgi:dienelactone hydrolase